MESQYRTPFNAADGFHVVRDYVSSRQWTLRRTAHNWVKRFSPRAVNDEPRIMGED